jgi:hypothetical protein
MSGRSKEEIIATRAERHTRRIEKAKITPVPVSGFAEKPIDACTIFKCMFPISGKLSNISVFVRGSGFKTAKAKVVLEKTPDTGVEDVRTMLVNAPVGRFSTVTEAFMISAGDRLSVTSEGTDVAGLFPDGIWISAIFTADKGFLELVDVEEK